jgi:hypothetical protein
VHKTEYLLPLLHKATGEHLEREGIRTHLSREGFQVRVCETRKHGEDDNSSRVFPPFLQSAKSRKTFRLRNVVRHMGNLVMHIVIFIFSILVKYHGKKMKNKNL